MWHTHANALTFDVIQCHVIRSDVLSKGSLTRHKTFISLGKKEIVWFKEGKYAVWNGFAFIFLLSYNPVALQSKRINPALLAKNQFENTEYTCLYIEGCLP